MPRIYKTTKSEGQPSWTVENDAGGGDDAGGGEGSTGWFVRHLEHIVLQGSTQRKLQKNKEKHVFIGFPYVFPGFSLVFL